ncbi:eukaryotic translation initiation factor 4E [Tieghemostelium lacteum]|uniref:Eukaryotic translation initiation factor 4E n=1 Tax=Tieghemostelium lacteum TaxID=361077 RepID=A0A151ZFB7_TIELA|nr:eukaryotic translation initiation factor 4E [Tieghemostelium lacteum]|eukprot:KYQ92672.1 eukaryotic translation initiation factor 4E [Tieghemostelium lacteum]
MTTTTKDKDVECLVEPTSSLSISDKSSENVSSKTQQQPINNNSNTETQDTEDTEEQTELNDNLIKHPLQNRWSLWYDYRGGKIDKDNWADSLKRIISFDTVEDFWCVFNNLPGVVNLKTGSSYHLFKDDIEPKWEHTSNIKGGKWVAVLKDKSINDKLWLQTVMACVGETFDSGDEICGIVYNARSSGDKISVWTKSCNEKSSKEIGFSFKNILETHQTVSFFSHEDAMRSTTKSVRSLYDI